MRAYARSTSSPRPPEGLSCTDARAHLTLWANGSQPSVDHITKCQGRFALHVDSLVMRAGCMCASVNISWTTLGRVLTLSNMAPA